MLAHGASSVVLDRLFTQSDEFECALCRHCGLIAETRPAEGYSNEPADYCRGCRLAGPENIGRVAIPYSFKLLHQELAGMNVAMRMMLEPRNTIPNRAVP